jgi:competence ComEA-like helix-hairpin-helix protein
MSGRSLPAQERGLLLLIAAAVLASGVVFYATRPTPSPAARLSPAEAIVLEDVAIVVPTFRDPAPIDPNRSPIAELVRLPGIGEVLAGRIVAYRETHGRFDTIDDLLAVQGIGPSILDGIRDLVTIGEEAGSAGPDQ